MKLSSREVLARLGAGAPIAAVCKEAGITRRDFDAWWRGEVSRRVPSPAGTRNSHVRGAARIDRDEWGIPHISAGNDDDLFFAFGYAMAQDRLFQMDWLRRKGMGRLAEVAGEQWLDNDITMRTIGVNRTAAAELKLLLPETRRLLERFSDGVNALVADSGDNLPVEFDLLGYRPEPWTPLSSLAIEGEFRWYLTVRLPVICMPEVARRSLGDGALLRAFMEGEADEESILPQGSYLPRRGVPAQAVGATIGDPYERQGSNNWVLAGSRTVSGKPLLASDPHIAFAAVSCWYEVALSGGSFNVAGMAYAGLPAVMFGRNEVMAWGITNNICSVRDIYQEKTDPAHPGCFLYDGRWEKSREVVEEIAVKGRQPTRLTVSHSRNGPVIDAILPAPARGTGPVTLKWLGSTYCTWLTSMLGMDRAKDAKSFRKAMDGWLVPTFSLVYADVNGNIGYQAGGNVPVRDVATRGYRPGWDPAHQWKGLIPQAGMPHLDNPERGWMATANNRPAPDDYPWPLSGTWSSGHRARRVRQMIEERTGVAPGVGRKAGLADMIAMHQDALSLRAADCLPGLRAALHGVRDGRLAETSMLLERWDGRYEVGEVGATLFESFFTMWCREVMAQRVPDRAKSDWLAGAAGGLATRLLYQDPAGWFPDDAARTKAVSRAMDRAVSDLESRYGREMSKWTWGSVHKIALKHVLSGVGDLGELLDRGGLPVKGNGVTVCNTGYDPNYLAPMGANYRLIADLSTSPPSLWAVDAQGQSGNAGSPHYCDQLPEWISGRYHRLSLDRAEVMRTARSSFVFSAR
jgi:penicillin amidase